MVIRSELLFVESMLTAKACGKGFLQKPRSKQFDSLRPGSET
jgi:hypothetical protein